MDGVLKRMAGIINPKHRTPPFLVATMLAARTKFTTPEVQHLLCETPYLTQGVVYGAFHMGAPEMGIYVGHTNETLKNASQVTFAIPPMHTVQQPQTGHSINPHASKKPSGLPVLTAWCSCPLIACPPVQPACPKTPTATCVKPWKWYGSNAFVHSLHAMGGASTANTKSTSWPLTPASPATRSSPIPAPDPYQGPEHRRRFYQYRQFMHKLRKL